jgi:chromate reductase, NAD(P)H dehydrogenase (quinone)
MKSLRITALSGSLRAQSFNTLALRAAEALLPEGVEMRIVDYSDVPLFSADVLARGVPQAVETLRGHLAAADGVLIASPEYNFSVSGVLKNAIDWLSKTTPQPFRHRPAAILSATTGPLGGARSQYELRKILGSLEAVVMPKPEVFIGMAASRFQDGRLADEATAKVLKEQLEAFRNWMRMLHSN